MIVPRFGAEARLRDRIAGRQVTIRRWGWSDESQAAAQTHAESRAREALERKRTGEDVQRREQKVAYNGADGFPIREEIVERHGETVVTRNGYGALCLNTPNVLFLDIDFPGLRHLWVLLLVPAAAGAALAVVGSWALAGVVCFLAFAPAGWLGEWLDRRDRAAGRDFYANDERKALKRIAKFVNARPDWEVRVYRTPVGLRVLVTHRTFDPNEPEVLACFRALRVDKLYARMCRRQKCFRARVSAKPWRAGVSRFRPTRRVAADTGGTGGARRMGGGIQHRVRRVRVVPLSRYAGARRRSPRGAPGARTARPAVQSHQRFATRVGRASSLSRIARTGTG
jgi:hypothetical protein